MHIILGSLIHIKQLLFAEYCSPKAKQTLVNINQDDVEINIHKCLLSSRRIIVLV